MPNTLCFPRGGGGHILVTDINSSDTEALICQSPLPVGKESESDWYLDPEDVNATSIPDGDRINETNGHGCSTHPHTHTPTHLVTGYLGANLQHFSYLSCEGRATVWAGGPSTEDGWAVV